MADTRPNITLPAGQWVNVYSALNAQVGYPSVTVGDKLLLSNIGSTPVRVTTKATEPTESDGFERAELSDYLENDLGSSGEWALSIGADGLINVKVLP